MMIIFFRPPSRLSLSVVGGCFSVVVILGTSQTLLPGASMATVLVRFIFLWAAEQICATILRRPKTCSAHCAPTFLILNPLWICGRLSKRGTQGCLVQMAWF